MYSLTYLLNMRRSLFRHPLAVLRHLIGPKEGAAMTQKEMADLLQCARVTVQKIENGVLNLSPELAKRISHETGARIAWLLDGDPSALPLTLSGAPYTRQSFEKFRARKTPNVQIVDALMMASYGLSCHVRIRAISESAHRRSADFQIVRYKLDRFLSELATEFGEDDVISKWDIREAAWIGVEESKACEKLTLKIANDILARTKQPTASKLPSRRARKA